MTTMRIRSRVTGETIEMADDGAQALIDAGIYEAAAETTTREIPAAQPTDSPPASPDESTEGSTKVEPLTTTDLPIPVKKGKSGKRAAR